ncbi:MAG: carboxypeptidase regulatory-like domain-containing protein [Acidobacteria bacterium]|nr:MAG: carboxypeptidase regulatory-like domain-containing protein [Acidobacteriota bacterium]
MSLRCFGKHASNLLLVAGAIAGMCCFSPLGLPAQNATSGSVTGQVVDAQGKAIVGAVATLTNVATNGVTPTVTNGAGRYSFSNLQPGTYTLAVKKAGFKSATVTDQLVSVGKNRLLNITMQVGSTTQTVEVTATGAELQTLNSTVASSLSGQAIVRLPSLNRDANALTNLQPEINQEGGVGGAAGDQNSFTLDGGNNTDDMDGFHTAYTYTSASSSGYTSGTIPTPAESVETFTITTQNQTADVNSAAGSTVAMVTKRGTDAVHGAAYDYYLGSYLSANDWGNNQAGIPRAKKHRNRFGVSLGGRLLPDWLGGKTYLYGLFEGLRYPQSPTFTRNTPTATLRAGVIAADNGSGNTEAVCGSAGAAGAADCADASHSVGFYNLNPNTVTVNNVAYAPASCTANGAGAVPCDPEKLGINPVVAQLWKQYMPTANNSHAGDHFNTQGFTGNIPAAQNTNFFVTRIDHDFGAKTHFTLTYHFFSLVRLDPNAQHDIGGGIPGDTFGVPATSSQRPQLPSMWTAQFTTNISSNVTNTFNYSYLRNFWQWAGSYLKPTPLSGFPALGGALEVGGESSNALIPYNVDTQAVRTRVWDGVGNTFKDDVSILHGNHLFQFGGRFTDQWDYHQRNDNGGGIMANTVYQVTNGPGIRFDYLPTDFGAGADKGTFNQYYAETLGMVSQPQTLYTRSGANLGLQPLGTPMFDNSYIPMYNVYFSDAWHVRPSLTVDFGAGYTVELPPREDHGKQVALVDAAGSPLDVNNYLASQERAALGGQIYNPKIGWATVGNVGGGLKYPYHPFYAGFSPRLALAWNPNIQGGFLGAIFGGNKAVLRGGWSRIYGRLNGVDLVLVPLLGTGLGQPVECIGASGSGQCLGSSGVDPTDAFRIGPAADGYNGMTAPLGQAPTPTLPQPYFSGELQNGVPNPSAGNGDFLDPYFRPNRSDEFDLTFQRQLTPSLTTMLGYTGRIIRNEYQETNLDVVPYMLTAGGQQFQQAFATLFNQIGAGQNDANPYDRVTASPFFTAALGGNNSAYCRAAGDCALAVAENEGPAAADNIDPVNGNTVFNLWQDLQSSPSWTFGRTNMNAPTTCNPASQPGCPANGLISGGGQLADVFDNDSVGWGNYNAFIWTLNFRNFHGLTGASNFTWARSMGTGQVEQLNSEYTVTDAFNMHAMYGPQENQTPLAYNAYFVWSPGAKSQSTFWQHLAHGWSLAPIITWQRIGANYYSLNGGISQVINGSQCGSFGESNCIGAYTEEAAILTTGYTGGSGIVRNSTYGQANPAQGGTGMDRWADPAAIKAEFRPIVLGQDTTGAEGNNFPGLSETDVDFSVTKDLALSERFSTVLNAQATNVFNHFSSSDNFNDINSPSSFGVIYGNQLNARAVEVGLLVRW